MAIDSNPRHFWMTVTEVDVNVMANADADYITLEFAGRVTPATRDRFEKALLAGEFQLEIKTFA